MRLTIEFYTVHTHPSVRQRLAGIVRQSRRQRVALTRLDWQLYTLWVIGAFKHDTRAVGWWLEQDWPVVRRGDGSWWTLDLQRTQPRRLHLTANLTLDVPYAKPH